MLTCGNRALGHIVPIFCTVHVVRVQHKHHRSIRCEAMYQPILSTARCTNQLTFFYYVGRRLFFTERAHHFTHTDDIYFRKPYHPTQLFSVRKAGPVHPRHTYTACCGDVVS